MIPIQIIRENPDLVISRLKIKNVDAQETVQQIIQIDAEIRALKKSLDDNLMEQNKKSKEIGVLFQSGKGDQANQIKERIAELKVKEKIEQEDLANKDILLNDLLVTLPNLPHESVPTGTSAEDNEIVFQEGEIGEPDDALLPHWELVKKFDIIDFDLGSKITGSGFPLYKGKGAKLQRALINFFLDSATNENYIEVVPPYMVNEDSAYATGQLPDKEGQMYHVTLDNLYLIPTAEVPITNIYRDTILRRVIFLLKTVPTPLVLEEKQALTEKR